MRYFKRLWYRIKYPRIEYHWPKPGFVNGGIEYEVLKGWFVGLTTIGSHPSDMWDRAMIIDDKLNFHLTDQKRIIRII